jgi:hypothetical protein
VPTVPSPQSGPTEALTKRTRTVLVLGVDSDPIVASFAEAAGHAGLDVCRPERFEDLCLHFEISGPTRATFVSDRGANRKWSAGQIAGVFYRDLPPFGPKLHLTVDDKRYAIGEVLSSLRAMCYESGWPVIGMPTDERSADVTASGIEARIAMSRLGLPVSRDLFGSLKDFRAVFLEEQYCDVFVSGADGSAPRRLLEFPDADAQREPETKLATLIEGGVVRAVVQVSQDHLIFDISRDGRVTPILDDWAGTELGSLLEDVKRTTGVSTGVFFFVLASGSWSVARISLRIPLWVLDQCSAWLLPRLVEVFE